MTDYCHVDGQVVPAEEAGIKTRDRGFLYGDVAGVAVRAYGGEPFEWAATAGRLRRAADALGFEHVLPPVADLRDRVTETLAANDLTEALVRVRVSRGTQDADLTPDPRIDPTITITVDPLPRGGTEGRRAWDEPATIRTVDRRRPRESVLPAALGTEGGLPGLLARLDLEGADEALLRSPDGHVTDCAATDLFFVHQGTLYAPTADLPFAPGVVRGAVLDAAAGESFPVETGRYTLKDVREADELFLTGPACEVRPVTAVDGHAKEIGPITRLCGRLFDERVEAAHY